MKLHSYCVVLAISCRNALGWTLFESVIKFAVSSQSDLLAHTAFKSRETIMLAFDPK